MFNQSGSIVNGWVIAQAVDERLEWGRSSKSRYGGMAMKSTFVLSLDEDTAAFLDQVRDRMGNEDPNAFINRLLRQERDRMGLAPREEVQGEDTKEMERFIDQQIPGAG
jgi:hypothetical protein